MFRCVSPVLVLNTGMNILILIIQWPLLFAFITSAFASFPDKFERNITTLIEGGLKNKKFVGLSLAIVNKEGQFIRKHFGLRDAKNKIAPDNSTLYELGSITKSFARLAIATQGTINLDDPISKFLPPGIRAPRPNGKEISIVDLITHTGIKFSVPCTFRSSNPQGLICYGVDLEPPLLDPYKNTSRENIFQFVHEFSYTVEEFPALFPEPGSFYSYSNVGVGLLGEILGEVYQTTFENYLTQYILSPLKMTSSKIAMSCEQSNSCSNIAKVYSKEKPSSAWEEKSLWHFPGMSAAGGLRSNIDDMEKFLRANLFPESTPLEQAVKLSQTPLEKKTSLHNQNICGARKHSDKHCNVTSKSFYYGWEAAALPSLSDAVLYHGGETGASQAMMIFSVDRSIGVIVLSNSKVGAEEQTLYHYPNDVAVCIYQLLGTRLSKVDFCKKISE